MDDLDRLYRRLVHNIQTGRPEFLRIPFTVRELYEHLVPYRHNRRELAIETNQDYETALDRLLSGERGYVRGDPAMQEALRNALASPVAEPGLFKDYGDVQLTLAAPPGTASTPTMPSAAVGAAAPPAPSSAAQSSAASATPVEPMLAESTAAAPAPEPPPTDEIAAGVTAALDAMSAGTTTPSDTPETVPSLINTLGRVEVPTGCRFCGGTLPEGREVNYCPHCGENLRTRRCPACGAEMDAAWRFCASCGRRSE